MTKWKWLAATAMAATILGLLAGGVAYATPSVSVAEAKQAKDDVIAKMREHSRELTRSIEELKSRASSEASEANATLKLRVADLEGKRDELEHQMKALRRSSGRAWTRLRSGLDQAWGNALQAAREARAEFEKSEAGKSLRE